MHTSRPISMSSFHNLPPPPPVPQKFTNSYSQNRIQYPGSEYQSQYIKNNIKTQKYSGSSTISKKTLHHLRVAATTSGCLMILLIILLIFLVIWIDDRKTPDQNKDRQIVAAALLAILSLLVVIIYVVATLPLNLVRKISSELNFTIDIRIYNYLTFLVQKNYPGFCKFSSKSEVTASINQVPHQNMNTPSQQNINTSSHNLPHELPIWNGIQIQPPNTGTYAESIAGTEVSWVPNMKSLVNGEIKPDQPQPDRIKLDQTVTKAKEEYLADILISGNSSIHSGSNYNSLFGSPHKQPIVYHEKVVKNHNYAMIQ